MSILRWSPRPMEVDDSLACERCHLRQTRRALVPAATLLLTVACLSPKASAAGTGDPGIMIIDANQHASDLSHGAGYDESADAAKPACVEFDRGAMITMADGGEKKDFTKVSSLSSVADSLDVSFSTNFQMAMGAVEVNASMGMEYLAKKKVSSFSHSVMAFNYRLNGTRKLDETTIKIKPKYLAMLNDSKGGERAFAKACGDSFVIGVQTGRQFIGYATVEGTSSAEERKIGVETGGDFVYGPYGGGMEGAMAKGVDKAVSSSKVNVKIFGTGSERSPTTMEGLLKAYRKWKPTRGPERAIKFQIASYKKWTTNYPKKLMSPWVSPKQEKIRRMVGAVWDLQALQNDYLFIKHHPDLFAFGTEAKKRKKNLASLTKLNKEWKKKFKEVRKSAKSCFEKRKKPCVEPKWVKGFDIYDERGRLPRRYTMNCDVAVDIAPGAGPPSMNLKHTGKGDANLGDNGIMIRGTARLTRNKNNELVYAFKKMTVEEWKKDRSGKRRKSAGIGDDWLWSTYSHKGRTYKKSLSENTVPLGDCRLDPKVKTSVTWEDYTGAIGDTAIQVEHFKPKGGPRWLKSVSCAGIKNAKSSKVVACTPSFHRTARLLTVNKLDLEVDKKGLKKRPKSKKAKAEQRRRKALREKNEKRRAKGKKGKKR